MDNGSLTHLMPWKNSEIDLSGGDHWREDYFIILLGACNKEKVQSCSMFTVHYWKLANAEEKRLNNLMIFLVQ
jgi:hypothetical protein